ncbi:MAG TPA: Holliday junction resolvase RuvX [Candidatus Saccharimonadales bacterium]|nr:Holliday junction resolvase RuvX [Candidatus Saccharimonadales bacterium]
MRSPDNHNILALDVGDARVGVAIANPIARIPNPLTILANGPKIFHEIQALIREHDVRTVVIGLPRNMKGEETAQTEASRRFADKLEEYTDAELVFADESLSSKRAEEDRSRRGRGPAEHLDDVAACFILEEHFLRNQDD